MLRQRGLAPWILILVITIGSGMTMGLVAGGRRASTSYDRLISWADGADVSTGGFEELNCPEDDDVCASQHADEFLTLAASLPQVAAASRSLVIGYATVLPDGQPLSIVSLLPAVVDITDAAGGRVKVLTGRIFDAAAADEAVIGFDAAERLGLDVGERVGVVVSDDGTTVDEVEIVGILAYPGGFPSFSGRVGSILALSPAFQREHPELVDWSNGGLSVKLRNGESDVDAYRQAVAAAGISFDNIESIHEQAAGPRHLVNVDAGILWLLALVVGFATLVVIAQMLRRSATAVTSELSGLAALGMRRRDFVAAAARSGSRVGGISAITAALLAIAISPAFPLGMARTADPGSGFSIDFTVLIVGLLATVLTTLALSLVNVVMVTRRAAPARARRSRLTTLTIRLPPAPSTGLRLALARQGAGQRRGSSAFGIGIVMATLLAVMTMSASLARLVANPNLSGATWDAVLVVEDAQQRAIGENAMKADERVAVATLGGWSTLTVNGRPVFTQVFEPGAGIEIATDQGRSPVGPTEIALARAELNVLGVSVGDSVNVSFDGGPSKVATVVGRAILAAPIYQSLRQGEGAAAPAALMNAVGQADATPSLLLRLHDREHLDAPAHDMETKVGANVSFTRPDQAAVQSLSDFRTTTDFAMALLGVLAGAALLQLLIVTTRARRHEIAVLRALGLTRAQVLAIGATAGPVVAVLASSAACLVGVIGSRFAWNAFAHYLFVVPDPLVPVGRILITLVSFVIVSAVGGTMAVWSGQRANPGELLRTE